MTQAEKAVRTRFHHVAAMANAKQPILRHLPG